MTDVGLDRDAADDFVERGLDPEREAALADQVARLLAHPEPVPVAFASALVRIVQRLGGEDALLAWMDQYPGRPRLVSRVLVLIGLLDYYSDRPAVVTALRELREDFTPPDLRRYLLAAETDATTLADLGGKLRLLLADEVVDELGRVALATTDMLVRLASRAAALDPGVKELGPAAERSRHAIREALQDF